MDGARYPFSLANGVRSVDTATPARSKALNGMPRNGNVDSVDEGEGAMNGAMSVIAVRQCLFGNLSAWSCSDDV